jgi:hypothetical protein
MLFEHEKVTFTRKGAVIREPLPLPLSFSSENIPIDFCGLDWLSFAFDFPAKAPDILEGLAFRRLNAFFKLFPLFLFDYHEKVPGIDFYDKTFYILHDGQLVCGHLSISVFRDDDDDLSDKVLDVPSNVSVSCSCRIVFTGAFFTFMYKTFPSFSFHFYNFLSEISKSPSFEKFRILRADFALDDYKNYYNFFDKVNYAHESNLFSHPSPSLRYVTNTDYTKGNTVYVGQRTSHKMIRVYEKGKSLGESDSPWVRLEIVLRNSGNYIIPVDVILYPFAYSLGIYTKFFELFDFDVAVRSFERKDIPPTFDLPNELITAHYLKLIKKQYGHYLRALRDLYEDDQLLLDDLIRLDSNTISGYPKRFSFAFPITHSIPT